MAATWIDTFCRGARKLQRAVGQPVCAVAVAEHNGGIAARTMLLGASSAEIEFSAIALLSDVKRGLDESDGAHCDHCEARRQRVAAALAILEQGRPPRTIRSLGEVH